ncbi:MAG: hypothetical protein E7643_01440 [Ruminococcaceae bacterium]|nr:hypothetical protein [Oscillospiraceae bacterium]
MIQKYKASTKTEERTPSSTAAHKNSGGMLLRKKSNLGNPKKESTDPIDYYRTANEAAKAEHRAASKLLSQQTEEKLRRAAVNYELLKKYLPIENEQAGLSGLGVSESADIEARNGYARRVGEIESEKKKSQSELDRAYRAEQTALAEAYMEEKAEEASFAREEERAEKANKRASQDSVYEGALKALTEEKFTTFSELDELLATVKPNVRDEQYAQLLYYVNYYKKHPDFIARDELMRKEKEA